jgi:hypothetical protein
VTQDLDEYPILDNDALNEVEAIIQDQAWDDKLGILDVCVKLQLESALVELWGDPLYTKHLEGVVVDGAVYVSDEHLKAAFWKAANTSGVWGEIENTSWVFTESEMAELAIKVVGILITNPNQVRLL